MFTKSVLAVTLFALTSPLLAQAAFASAGSDQLAAQAGVQPGLYTDAQLINLLKARLENDPETVAYILSQVSAAVSRNATGGQTMTSAGAAQLAANLGVAPGAYSVDTLIQLQSALLDNDTVTVAAILRGSKDGNAANDVGVVTPGKAQLAAALQVDPAAYTTLDLARMYGALQANNS